MFAIEELRRTLEQMPQVRLAVLFGSAARGTANPKSDLDVGVSLTPGVEADVLPAVSVALERTAGRSVDLIWLDQAPPLLRFEIARSGHVLVQRDHHDWAEFRAHAMIDWWDWAPTARMMHLTLAARLAEEVRRGPS